MALDARWTINAFRQAKASVPALTQNKNPQWANKYEAPIAELIQRFKVRHAGQKPARILLVGDQARYRYYLERAKYLLLPDSAHSLQHLNDRLSTGAFDYAMFVGDFSDAGSWSSIWAKLPVDETWKSALELEDSDERVILFRIAGK